MGRAMGQGAFRQTKGQLSSTGACAAPRAPGSGNAVLGAKFDAPNRPSRCSSIAGNWAIKSLSSPCKFGAVLLCQSPNYDRSAGVAGAVRDHSSAPRPAGAVTGGARAPLATRQACVLTQTRWDAKRVAASLCGGSGSGGAVLHRTAAEPLQNRQPLEIITNFSRFSRFYATASRDARAPVCVQPRVHVLGVIHRTIEPLGFMYNNQCYSGSMAVLRRFWSEPGLAGALDWRGSAAWSNKLAGGYRAPMAGRVPVKASSTVLVGRAAQSFGDFGRGLVGGRTIRGRGGRPGWGDRGADLVLEQFEVDGRKNGGVLRFWAGRSGRVGRVMLEGWPLRLGVAWFAGDRPLPVSLGAGHEAGGGRAARRAPPSPPFARAHCSSTLALAAGRVWIGLPASAPHCRAGLTVKKIAKVGVTATGRGWLGWVAAGMQRRAGVLADGLKGREPRENGHASAGGSHVNR